MSRIDQKSETIVRKYYHAEFLICNSCLWCASLLNDNYIQGCLSCGSEKIESIPIGKKEAYKMDINVGSVSVEFWDVKK
jgi:hypothetical protein